MAKEREMKSEYDLIIVGAGIAGLSGAMYGARLGLKVLCLGATTGSELPIGGIVTTTNIIENYPGFERITGAELAEKLKSHAESYELVTIKAERVESIEKLKGEFNVKTSKGIYSGKAILLATGTAWKKLDVPGAKEFENKGVAYCALCDAPLFKNKTVAVIGGSNTAVKYAVILKEYAKKVYIIYRKEKIRADDANIKKIESCDKIEIINNTNVKEIKGEKVVKSVILDREFKGSKELKLDGVFVAIGYIPTSQLAKEIGVELNENEEIVINHKTCETNIEGVFAAGDIVDKHFKQVISAAAEGCKAAYYAQEYLTKKSS